MCVNNSMTKHLASSQAYRYSGKGQPIPYIPTCDYLGFVSYVQIMKVNRDNRNVFNPDPWIHTIWSGPQDVCFRSVRTLLISNRTFCFLNLGLDIIVYTYHGFTKATLYPGNMVYQWLVCPFENNSSVSPYPLTLGKISYIDKNPYRKKYQSVSVESCTGIHTTHLLKLPWERGILILSLYSWI